MQLNERNVEIGVTQNVVQAWNEVVLGDIGPLGYVNLTIIDSAGCLAMVYIRDKLKGLVRNLESDMITLKGHNSKGAVVLRFNLMESSF